MNGKSNAMRELSSCEVAAVSGGINWGGLAGTAAKGFAFSPIGWGVRALLYSKPAY